MRRIVLFLAIVCAFSMLALPALAQQTTSTPMPVGQVNSPAATTTPGVNQANTTGANTVRVRLADFAADGPTFVVYVNNSPSAIPNLTFPSMTAWLELPSSTAQSSFIPQGAAKSLALASPVTVSAGNWTTIALVGSVNANTVSAVQINADVGTIPQGCARVTVFNAVEGGQNFDLMSNGTSLASGLAFPGAMGQPNTTSSNTSSTNNTTGSNTTAMSTAEATSTTGSAASCANSTETTRSSTNMTMTGSTACTLVSPAQGTTGATSTEAAGAATTGTQEAGSSTTGMNSTTSQMSSGQIFNNCAFTFDVPAGTLNLSANANGSMPPLASMANMSFAPDTYYFVALISVPSSPRVFTFSFPTSSISGMMSENHG